MDTKLKSFTCDKIHLMMIILTEVGALLQKAPVLEYTATLLRSLYHRYIWTDVYILSLPSRENQIW